MIQWRGTVGYDFAYNSDGNRVTDAMKMTNWAQSIPAVIFRSFRAAASKPKSRLVPPARR